MEVYRNLLSKDVQRHLHRGLIVRLGMVEASLRILSQEIGKSAQPLCVDSALHLTLLLNAYYLNLTASLDNLAWALIYQNDLIKDVDENNIRHRKFANLFNEKFLSNLYTRGAVRIVETLKQKNLGLKKSKNLGTRRRIAFHYIFPIPCFLTKMKIDIERWMQRLQS